MEWAFKPLEIKDLNIDDRLYLHCDLDLVWLSDSKRSILLSTNSGTPIGSIIYPNYKRAIPEIYWEDENTSPYAQTGNSVWEIGSNIVKYFDTTEKKNPFIIIVHDIERCTPVAADLITIPIF